MIYYSKYDGLKIGIKPEKRYRDKHDNPIREDGHKIKFVNGEYETDDSVEINFMKEYMKKWPGEVTKVDPKELAKEVEIRKRVVKEMEKEDAEKEKQAKADAKTAEKDRQKRKDDASEPMHDPEPVEEKGIETPYKEAKPLTKKEQKALAKQNKK